MRNIFRRTIAMLLTLVTLCSLLLAGGGLHQEAEAASYTYLQTVKDNAAIRSGPADTYAIVKRGGATGSVLKSTGSTTNSSGNVWYQLSDGNWIFSGNVVKHNHSYTGGICNSSGCGYEWGYSVSSLSGYFQVTNSAGAKIWSRPYSNKSTHVRTAAQGNVLTVIGKTTNQEGNVWYKISDGYWVFSGNVTQRFTVTFNANGGKNPPAAMYVLSGKSATVPSTKPTRVGYVFQGWAPTSTATAASLKPGNSAVVKQNITLYAVWKACSHSYTGGICDVCQYEFPISVTSYKHEFQVTNADGAKIWSRPYSNKSTHIRTEKKGTVLNVVGITLNEENHTWMKLSDGYWVYTENISRRIAVKYNANGGKGAPATQYFLAGNTLTLSKTKPTRVGYLFKGWATNSSATSADYAPGAKYSKQSNVTLYAVWKACKHPDTTGGICDDCAYELPVTVTAMSNTTFVVTNKDGSTVYTRPYSKNSTKLRVEPYEKALTVVGKATNAEGNLWYKLSDGSWTYSGNLKQRYSVKYDANGGKGGPSAQYFLKGQDITLSKTKPTRVGYLFQGWATSESSTTVSYKPGAAYTSDKSLKLYAVWKKCSSHDYSGGICSKCKYEYPLSPSSYQVKIIVTNAEGASIWTRPYSNNSTKVRVDAKGKVLTTKAKVENQAGNIWYQLTDGNWVFSGNVKRGYTITFSANGGSNPPAPIVAQKGAKVAVPSAKPVRSGYTFLGWSTTASGAAELKVGYTYPVPGDITVYAVWAKNAAITSNPAGRNAAAGTTTSFTVKATGTGLTYQWQCRKNANSSWVNCSDSSALTTTLKVATTGKDGYQYRCKVTDKYGNTAISAIATLRVLGIVSQPQTAYAQSGATVRATVQATGSNLSYQWYFKDTGSTSYKKSSVTSATYSVTMSSSNKNRMVYCVITDASGNTVKTNTVYLRMAATITAQPKTSYTKLGEVAKVTLTAEGDGLTYQWYVKDVGDTEYVVSSHKTNTCKMQMSTENASRRAYCVIKDKYGNTVKSNTVEMRMAASVATQPKSVTVAKGATAKVTFKAAGDGLKYEWYYKDAGASSFKKTTAFTGNTYHVTMTAARSGRQLYCKVTDKYGNTVKTNTVTIKMK